MLPIEWTLGKQKSSVYEWGVFFSKAAYAPETKTTPPWCIFPRETKKRSSVQ